MQQRLDIAIIGAGVTGLAVATALARLGHRAVVYERYETSAPVGSGLLLQPTGLAALERLGLADVARAVGHPIERLKGLSASRRTIFDVAYGDLRPGLRATGIHRAALHRLLADAFAMSGARFEGGAAIETVEPRADGRLSPATPSGQVFPPADLVLDCSGARSPIRRLVSDDIPVPFPYGAVWTTVLDRGWAPYTLAQRYVGARTMAGHLPVGRVTADGPNLAAVFWSLKVADHARWQGDYASFRLKLAALWPEVAEATADLAGPESWTLAEYTHFTARHIARRNLVLLGDSAHCTSPQLGQGANNGLIDAVVFADALEECRTIDDAVARFTGRRRAHMRFYQLASRLMTPMFQSDSRLLPVVRDAVLPALRLVPYVRREMVRTLAGLKTGLLTSAEADHIAAPGIRADISPPLIAAA